MVSNNNNLVFIAPPYKNNLNNSFIRLIRLFQDWFFAYIFKSNLKGMESVLDVGCGYNSPLRLVHKTFHSCGIDAYKPALLTSKSKKIHDIYILGDFKNIDKLVKKKSFDVVIACEVIEHVSKKDSIKLISDIEKIARKKIIITTPNGFNEHDAFDGNPYQVHKCFWTTDDFKTYGYKVYGGRGAKFLRGKYGAIYKKPWIFWAFISFVSEPLLYCFPKLSYDLIAIKDLNSEHS